MPFSHRPSLDAQTVQTLPTLQERYALRRCMADTALGKLYWAQDLKQTQGNGEQTNVLVFTLLPALAQNPVFEQAFGHVLHGYQKPTPGMPHIIDDGKTANGLRWIIIRNSGGMLLTERLAELDDRGMPVPEALELLDSLSNAIANQRPDGIFGYLEPDTVLLGDKLPCLLTSPVAAALRATYNSTPNERSRQTLHSGYISPEVLLGDTPTTADDTFSIASLAYHLLQGEAPFGKQSALEATVRNLSPTSIRKLRPEAWAVLRQGLDLKRANRHKNPTALLRTLQRKQQKKLLLPLAALVAAGAVAMTTYQLLSSRDNQPTNPSETAVTGVTATPSTVTSSQPPTDSAALVGETSLPPALDQDSVQAQADKLAAETAANTRAEAERLAAATAATAQAELAADNDLSTLQDNAADAIRKGNLFSTDSAQPAAVDYLRKAIALNADDTKTQQLLAQLINDQHTEAEALLSAGKLDEASTLLGTADRLITEFTFADGLKRQVSLETEVEQAKRKQALTQETSVTAPPDSTPPAIAADTPSSSTTPSPLAIDDDARQYLERAQRAISFGNLNTGDDRGESAVAYLSTLLEKTPDQPDALKLLEKVATLQQDNALAHLRKRDTDKARTALNDSQALIGKYKLDGLVEEQIALEKRYRETLAMGVFVPGKEIPEPTTASKAVPAKATAKPALAPPETENPEAAAAAATPAPAAVISAPVEEIRVPADIPVQDIAPVPATTELPPIQLDAPPPTPQPAPLPPPPANNVTFEVPVTDADNAAANPNGNTFTPDVPNLMELPLDTIKDLPPATNQ
jgi:tetratricopeptide (TPR) repeat protein